MLRVVFVDIVVFVDYENYANLRKLRAANIQSGFFIAEGKSEQNRLAFQVQAQPPSADLSIRNEELGNLRCPHTAGG